MNSEVLYQNHIPEAFREQAVALYEEAFGPKFAVAIPDKAKRLHLLSESFQLAFAYVAMVDDELLGLAGYQTQEGSLTNGITLPSLYRHLGLFGGTRAVLVFSLFERKARPAELVMDGISVSKAARGQGIGSQLLECLKTHAAGQGYQQIRLDVIDTNPAAKRLYERQGFVAEKTEHFPFLRGLLGFGGATTMVYKLDQ